MGRAGDSQGKMKALGVVVKAKLALEQSFDALMAAKDELAMIKRGKEDKVAEMGASDLLHTVYMNRGEYQPALEVLEEILPTVKGSGEKEKEAVILNKLAELKISLRKAGEACSHAQDARKIYEDLKSTDGVKESDRMLSWAYTEKGQVEKAPHRDDALEALKLLAQAASNQQRSDWAAAIEDLNRTCAFTQKDMKKIIDKALEEDKAGATEFFKEVGIEAAEDAVAVAKGEGYSFKEVPHIWTYISFRVGGLGYGPRFRACHAYKSCKGSARGPTGDESLYKTSGAIEIHEGADDWERQLQFNPSIMDASLHVGTSLGYSAD